MTDAFSDAEFFDDPNVPQYWIDEVQEVRIRGNGTCEIVPATYRMTIGGVWIKQPSHTCLTTLAALPAMATLVLKRAGAAAIGASIETAARALRLH